jgi:hypothetical protein
MTSNAVRQLDERQRALKAVELRVQGHTYAQMPPCSTTATGGALGCSLAVRPTLRCAESESTGP